MVLIKCTIMLFIIDTGFLFGQLSLLCYHNTQVHTLLPCTHTQIENETPVTSRKHYI